MTEMTEINEMYRLLNLSENCSINDIKILYKKSKAQHYTEKGIFPQYNFTQEQIKTIDYLFKHSKV